jgi:hypothetical protein
MDPMNAAPVRNPDTVLVDSAPRPTPRPARVAFSDVLAAGANGIAQGAQLAVSAIPGSAVTAAAVRGSGTSPTVATPGGSLTAEGPGTGSPSSLGALGGISPTTGTGGGISIGGVNVGGTSASSSGDPTSSIEATIQQSANLNLYYLQVQQQEDAQNRAYTAQSNILKTEHDGAKNAIGNIHS